MDVWYGFLWINGVWIANKKLKAFLYKKYYMADCHGNNDKPSQKVDIIAL